MDLVTLGFAGDLLSMMVMQKEPGRPQLDLQKHHTPARLAISKNKYDFELADD